MCHIISDNFHFLDLVGFVKCSMGILGEQKYVSEYQVNSPPQAKNCTCMWISGTDHESGRTCISNHKTINPESRWCHQLSESIVR